jgi:hypothetical protein
VATYSIRSRDHGWLVAPCGVPQTPEKSPIWGSDMDQSLSEGGGSVKLIKRLAVAMGSLLALAFAGGAHVRW